MGSSDSSIYSNLVPKKFQGRSRGETLKHVQYASNQEYGSIKCIAERINLLWTYIQQNFLDNAIVQQGDQKWGLILQIISLSSCFWNWTWNQIIYACLWLKYVVLCFLLLLFMFYIPLFVFYVPLFVFDVPLFVFCIALYVFISPCLCLRWSGRQFAGSCSSPRSAPPRPCCTMNNKLLKTMNLEKGSTLYTP